MSVFLLEVLAENLFPCLFPLLEATRIPWFMAPSSIFKARSVKSLNFCLSLTSASIVIFLFDFPAFFSPSKCPYDYVRSTWIIQYPHFRILNLITYAKSLLPCKVTYSQVQGLGWRMLWSHYSACHNIQNINLNIYLFILLFFKNLYHISVFLNLLEVSWLIILCHGDGDKGVFCALQNV